MGGCQGCLAVALQGRAHESSEVFPDLREGAGRPALLGRHGDDHVLIGSREGWASAFDAGDNVIELDLDEEGPLAAGGSTGGVTLTTSADKVPARVGVKNSSGKDALFEKCDGYLHVGYMIYRNQGLRALWICLSAATKPIEEEHSSTLMSHKTNDGSLDWSCNMAMGTNVTYLNRVLGTLIDADTLVEACLQEGSFYGQMGFHSRAA